MATRRPKPKHGTRACYVGGCRRVECRAAESAYQRERRHSAPRKLSAVSTLASPPASAPLPDEPGRVEAAVLAEIEGLATAEKRPGLAQAALAMARILDSPLNTAQQPQAGARLESMLDKLRKGADSRKGWLADVRRMTPRNQAG